METLAENRRAEFDYDLLEKFEAGLEFHGGEVKSVKAGRMELPGSYAIVRNGEAWLINAKIPPYQPKNALADYDPTRSRRLLLQKREIAHLAGKLAYPPARISEAQPHKGRAWPRESQKERRQEGALKETDGGARSGEETVGKRM